MQFRDSNGQFMPEGRLYRLSIRVTGAELALAHILAERADQTLTRYICDLIDTAAKDAKPKGGDIHSSTEELLHDLDPGRQQPVIQPGVGRRNYPHYVG